MGSMRGVARVGRAVKFGLAGVVTGLGSGGPAPASADCGMQFPPTTIGPHLGFAFDGVIRSIERNTGPYLERITMDVTP